jgi:hypothetical protein
VLVLFIDGEGRAQITRRAVADRCFNSIDLGIYMGLAFHGCDRLIQWLLHLRAPAAARSRPSTRARRRGIAGHAEEAWDEVHMERLCRSERWEGLPAWRRQIRARRQTKRSFHDEERYEPGCLPVSHPPLKLPQTGPAERLLALDCISAPV